MPISDQEIADLMYVDPGKALAIYGERIKQEVRAEYAQVKNAEGFYREFYNENPDLAGNHDEVRIVLDNNQTELGPMPVSQAKNRLADLTRQKLERERRKMMDPAERDRRVMLGGPGTEGISAADAAAISNDHSFDQPESFSSIINRRKEARREATTLGRRRRGE